MRINTNITQQIKRIEYDKQGRISAIEYYPVTEQPAPVYAPYPVWPRPWTPSYPTITWNDTSYGDGVQVTLYNYNETDSTGTAAENLTEVPDDAS